MKVVTKMNLKFKKIYFIYLIIAVITAVLAAASKVLFVDSSEIGFINIISMFFISLLICMALSIDNSAISNKIKAVLSLIMFIVTPLFLLIAVMNNYDIAMIRLWSMNYAILFAVLMLALAISNSAVSIIVVTVLAYFVFALNYEVTAFRGMPVVPPDIFAFSTALSVSNNYRFELSYSLIKSLQLALLWCVLAAKFNCKPFCGVKKRLAFGLSAIVFTVSLCGVISGYFKTNNPDTLYYDKYDTNLSNKRFGTLLTYYINAEKMIIKKPVGYSKQAAEDILNEVSNSNGDDNGVKPNVVVIMDEAFSDLTGVYAVATDKAVLPKLNELEDNTVKGNMLASVFGGNTCVTEFEFLTGLTAGNFDTETNAFTQSVTKNVHSICSDFKALDYTTIAIHPFWENSWRRNKVYPLLGFDKCIFAENFGTGIESNSGSMRSKPQFGDFEYIRGYLSDGECFNKIKEQFENKSEGERLFVFNVTIQNHGGYSYNGDDFENEIRVCGELNEELDQYLTLANKSDTAINELIEYFKDYNEPTVVVVFGDHQPNIKFSRQLNDDYTYLGNDAKYVVPFVIWANYDIEEKEVELISPAYLSTLVKQSCGLPKNNWDRFRDELYQKYPALTLKNCYNSNLEKLEIDDIDDELYNKYKILQYAILFDGVTP